MTPGELGAFVQAVLRKQGIDVVLSGGMVAQIYSANQYTSRDLDLVPTFSGKRRIIKAAMLTIGFASRGDISSTLTPSFWSSSPPGPLTVGDEPIKAVNEIRYSTGVLRLISPTDCVKDRLAAFYFWGDRQSLSQALMVAKAKRVNLTEIRRWSRSAGMEQDYQVFLRKLSTKRKAR